MSGRGYCWLDEASIIWTIMDRPSRADAESPRFIPARWVPVVCALVVILLGFPADNAQAAHGTSVAWLNSTAPTDTDGDWGPSIATDGQGAWVGVWTLQGQGGSDIFYARSTDRGHTWSAASLLGGRGSGNDLLPKVAWDGSGVWMVVWAAEGSPATGNDRDIYVSRSVDGGISWTSGQPLNTNAATDARFDSAPQVAGDGDGNWVAVWDSLETAGGPLGTDADIFVARSGDGGISWSNPAPLNSDAATDELRDLSPAIETDGNGNWVAAWETLNSLGPSEGSDNDVVKALSSDNGVTWTMATPLHPDMLTDTGQDHLVQIETTGDGMWLAIWQSKRVEPVLNNRDVLAARSYDAGATWTAPADVRTDATTDVFEEYSPQVATDGGGNWVVAWDGHDGITDPDALDTDVFAALSTDGALTWRPTALVHAGEETDSGGDQLATVAADGKSNWVVAWTSDNIIGGGAGPDGEILYVSCLPFDVDGDGNGRCADVDDDGDLVGDLDEGSCGSDPMDSALRPERLDGVFAGTDDDGDGAVDNALPAGATAFDCDGDGYPGAAEATIFGDPAADQDACGMNGWPAELYAGGIPESTDRVNLLDITSFLAPTRYLDTNPGDAAFDVRWDLVPGPGPLLTYINLEDLTSIIILAPPMLEGQRANNGPPCPWP